MYFYDVRSNIIVKKLLFLYAFKKRDFLWIFSKDAKNPDLYRDVNYSKITNYINKNYVNLQSLPPPPPLP